MNYRKTVLVSVLLIAVLFTLPGQSWAQETTARLRFLHAVPGAPDIDIYLDGALVAPGQSYEDATPYLTVAAGEHQVAVRQAGTDAAAAALVEVPVSLASSLAYSLVVQGTPDAVEAALYEDVLDELAPGMARLTAINTISGAPALDVLTATGGPLLQGVNYATQYGTINIPAGVQDLVVVPAGGSVEGAVATIGQVPLHSGSLYTLLILGTLEGPVTPSVLVLASPLNGAPDSARLRVAHGSPDTGAVDVYANDVLLAPSLELGQMTGHIALPAGATTVALRPAGSAATDAPTVSADVTLEGAMTVVATGEAGDNSLALQVFPDMMDGVTPENARIAVVNAVTGSTATVTLSDPSATVLASELGENAQGDAVDVPPGAYMLTVSIQGIESPVDVVVPEQVYAGGVYYSVLVFGGGAAQSPYDARVAATEIDVTVESLPGASGEAVAAAPTPAEVAPAEATPTPAEVAAATEEAPAEVVSPTPITDTELVTDEPGTSTEIVPATPAEVVPAATPQPVVTQPPVPIGFVELDPGANLHCREYPRADARSLGLIPSGAQLTIIGRIGPELPADTGSPTPAPTPVVETIEQLWLSVEWNTGDGGYVQCWVNAQYLRIEFRGKLLDQLEELIELLPEVPFNQPGQAVNTTITPPTEVFDAILATVNLDPGVSLQLRRDPKTSAEALDRVPAGAQLEVLGYIEAPSEGLVGQPVDPNWLRVRYRKENGGATVGWVSAQYVTLSKLGRSLTITDVPLLETAEPGFYETPGQQPVIPLEQQAVVGVVNLDPGANLNLRDRPSDDAFVVRAIPTGSVLTINGRNGAGTWVQVTFEAEGAQLEGWVNAQYLVITRGGQPYNIADLPNLSTEPDTMGGQPAPAEVVPTPTATVAQ